MPEIGREEIRAALLKPFLLRLRDQSGDAAVRTLLATAGLPLRILEDDAGWLSVAGTRRALAALSSALGAQALESSGEWMTHPEVLGAYVRMLRVATTPEDAYRYRAANSSEITRVGTYALVAASPGRAEITYTPRPQLDTDQTDRLLCVARLAEIAAIPRIFGLPEATVDHPACIARGDAECRYLVRWQAPNRQLIGVGCVLGAALCAGAVGVSGNVVASTIAGGIGAGFGSALGALWLRIQKERRARAFEKHRIAALERGLEVHGAFRDAASDLVRTTLAGKYRISRKIGSGGIGAVYAAEHVALGARVAIKVLRGAAAMDAAEIARLRREARVQVSIEHPNVVRVLDLDQLPDGSIFVVMELLEGESLAARLKTKGSLSAEEAVPIFRKVCDALSAAHQLGVVHRDLKPGNVFLCSDGTVKVLDFGMSKFTEAEALTQDGYTLGTPEYMAPEQCIGAPVDARTDLYAFGVLMYETLTGTLPIPGRSRRELLELHQSAIPKPFRAVRPDLELPAALERAVLQCLRKRAAERPATARELDKLLAEVPLGDPRDEDAGPSTHSRVRAS